MAARKRMPPALAPGYERVPGPQRHYRVIATGEEISRRQYQQRARGYRYEQLAKGGARASARQRWTEEWVKKVRERHPEFRDLSKTAVIREWKRMGMFPPHHGKRRPSPAEAAKEQAFLDFMGYARPAAAQLYPTLEGGSETVEGVYLQTAVDSMGRLISPRTTSSPGSSGAPIPR